MDLSIKLKAIIGTAAFTLALITFEHFDGGVITHYPLADDNLPGISNWWGMLTIPLLTWITFSFTGRRKNNDNSRPPAHLIKNPYLLGGLVFGAIVGLLWEIDQEAILQYFIMLPVLLALFAKVYLPESLLGFALGMLYTFGGVLPIGIGLVLQVIGFIIYVTFHRSALWVFARFNQ
ncbi:MAG: hypothetical protein RIC80_06375 [Cyclobacteriaceae bacterium]